MYRAPAVGSPDSWRRDWLCFGAFLAGSLVFFLYARWNWVDTGVAFNADEAQLWVSGRISALNPAPLQGYAGSTIVPAWPLFIGVLLRMGFPDSFAGMHLLAILMLATTCAFVAARALRYFRWPMTVSLWMSSTVVLALGGVQLRFADFMPLATELLPIMLLAASWFVLFTSRPSGTAVVIGCALAGVAPLAKLQSVPLAVATMVAVVLTGRLQALSRPTVARALPWAAFLAPSIALLIAVIVSGTLEEWVHEYVLQPLYYKPSTPSGGFGFVPLTRIYGGVLLVTSQPWLALPYLLAVGVMGATFGRWSWRLVVAVCVVLVAAFISVATSGTGYPHYLFLWWAGGWLLAIVAGWFAAVRGVRISWDATAIVSSLCAASMLFAFFSIQRTTGQRLPLQMAAVTRDLTAAQQATEEAVGELCPPGSRVAIWGFSPDLFIRYGWVPATRHLTNDIPTQPDPFWRSLQLGDLRQAMSDPRTACVIDASSGGTWKVGGELRRLTDWFPGSVSPLATFEAASGLADSGLRVWVR